MTKIEAKQDQSNHFKKSFVKTDNLIILKTKSFIFESYFLRSLLTPRTKNKIVQAALPDEFLRDVNII